MPCISIIAHLKLKKCFGKVEWFSEKLIHNFSDSILQIIVGVFAKKFKATLLFIDFSKSFDFIHREKMEQILLAYGLLKDGSLFYGISTLFGSFNTESSPFDEILFVSRSSYIQIFI